MGLFVTTTSATSRHGVFGIEVPPPSTIVSTGTGQGCLVEQFPGGPSQTLYTPTSNADWNATFAPRGFSRTGSGVLAAIAKGWPVPLKTLRVLGSAATTATITVNKTGPTALVTVTLKYPGLAGNSVTATTLAASDGNSNHFDLQVTITGASGTTTDWVKNINVSGTGADSIPDVSSAVLIGSITKNSAGVPILGSWTSSGGADGTIAATQYVGTPGANDFGFAKLEGDQTIDHLFVGDPGNSLRPTVNAGGVAHAELLGDRIFYMNGPSGQTPSQAQTDVATYTASRHTVYVDPWVNIKDDSTGASQLVPGAPFAASVASQLPPSTSIAWKNTVVKAMLNGIVSLEADRGSAAGTNTNAGIATLVKARKGGFVFEAGVVTDTTPGYTTLCRARMGIYIMRSIRDSIESQVDAPSVPVNQQDIVNAVDQFMSTLKQNQNRNPNFNAHVLDYSVSDFNSVNTPATLAAGQVFIPLQVKVSPSMADIFVPIQYGETVSVTHQ